MPFFYQHHDMERTDLNMCCFKKKKSLLPGFLWLHVLIFLFPVTAMSQNQDVIRVGFSSALFENVNYNDAIASIRAWAQALLKKQDISAVPKPVILNDKSEIKEVLSNNMLDYISLTTTEYAEVSEMLPCDTITVSVTSDLITEEYLLLVHKDSGIESLQGLNGKKLRFVSGARMSMAMTWLDNILLREKFKPAVEFFSSLELNKNAGRVILPVFFKQADACVVTRNMFDTMVELNPQIGRRLKIIAVSSPLVPSFFCFTRNSDESLRKKVSSEILHWHLSSFGKQSLTMFQCDGLEIHPVSCLETALDLIDEHKMLLKQAASSSGLQPEL